MKRLYTFGRMKQLFNAKAENIKSNSFVKGVSIDSRTLKEGDLFFCIKGKKTDGHIFIQNALDRGASGIVANQRSIPLEITNRKFQKFLVSNPNKSFGTLASDFRQKFKGKVIAITGSNGKTTTKEIIKNLCSFIDPLTSYTFGNFNNDIGVPITLLNGNLEAKWWIIEIGTNNFGEIQNLSRIVKPTAGIITSVGESHLEFLKSTKGVAKEKSGLFAGIKSGKNIVMPDSILHKEFFENEASKYGLKITKTIPILGELFLGKTKFKLFDKDFETTITSPLILQNLVMALTILYLEGVPVSKLIAATSMMELKLKGRFNQIIMKDWILVDDTYNANPSSFTGVLQDLKKMYPNSRKIAVCGAMAELGDLSNYGHFEVGKNMIQNGVDYFLGLGGKEIDEYIKGWKSEGGNSDTAMRFSDLKKLVGVFKSILQKGDVVLVKGSRSSHMEDFVDWMF